MGGVTFVEPELASLENLGSLMLHECTFAHCMKALTSLTVSLLTQDLVSSTLIPSSMWIVVDPREICRAWSAAACKTSAARAALIWTPLSAA